MQSNISSAKSKTKVKLDAKAKKPIAHPKHHEVEDSAKQSVKQSASDASLTERSLADRDALIKQYLPYATSLTAKMIRFLPSEVEFDDVLCNARLGLLEAAKRFDENAGVDFKTFAYYRIKGAIYDGLRKNGWIPRSLYSKIKFEQAANDYFEVHAQKMQAQQLSHELDSIQNVNSVASIYIMSIDSNEEFELEDEEANKQIEQKAEFQKIKSKVCDAIECLPDKERKLIKMYYFQGKTMEEVGAQLDLSKSWASRLHARSLELLFEIISKLGADHDLPLSQNPSIKDDEEGV